MLAAQGGRPASGKRVFLAGATGYIGRNVARELIARGWEVVCFTRRQSGVAGANSLDRTQAILTGCEVRVGEVCEAESLRRDGFRGEAFDAVVSCLASRSGGIEDSWRIDYQASKDLLDASLECGASHFLLLSAICVQKPRLAFQQAKLKMERELAGSGITWTIVRPTAFFKSLSGQIEAVKRGRPFTVFRNSRAACKPIAEADLAAFMADCLEDPARQNRILPIGGPGPALSAEDCGRLLFELLGREPKFRRVPLSIFTIAIPLLSALGLLLPRFRDKAEFARIGRYYATESMLVLDAESGEYDAAATPSHGGTSLRDFYRRALENGLDGQELGDHALFAGSGGGERPQP